MTCCATLSRDSRQGPLAGKVICLDPGHGGTAEFDDYRIGPTGEREEWINLRVGLFLKQMLEEKGARVLMSRIEDVQVPLKDRADLARENNADVFLSLHHNATADPGVNFPIIYFHGNATENRASVKLGKCVAKRIHQALFEGKGSVSLVSDYTIFPGGGTSVLRNSYGIPGVIGEASFFSHPGEEQRLKKEQYNRKEARAYVLALEDFFSAPAPPILEKFSTGEVLPFEVFQEKERMNETARMWHEDFLEAQKILKNDDPDTLQKAYDLFTRSARSFPDSPVAKQCHAGRVLILKKTGKTKEALQEQMRVNEFYISPEGKNP